MLKLSSSCASTKIRPQVEDVGGASLTSNSEMIEERAVADGKYILNVKNFLQVILPIDRLQGSS